MAELANALPPGWDCKYDPRTSRYYFINHYTKQTTWEDPRLRYRQIHGTPTRTHVPVEHIPLQHGSPEFRRNYVYPSQTCPQPAFQMPKSVPVQDLSNLRASNGAAPGTPKNLRETTLAQVPTDTEQAVSKISTMFPTVADTHIRLLMKKYYNREAVVISALQVEKYPITTPGPFTTPPPGRSPAMRAVVAAALNAATRSGSPMAALRHQTTHPASANSSPKPHSSPKMKLRYMKSIFPQVEETVLLEVLGNNENNVQKASEALKEMGFEKKDMKLTKSNKNKREASSKHADEIAQAAPVAPKILTQEEKVAVKIRLQEKYRSIPERVVVLALESADYNSARAQQILDVVVQEETAAESGPNSAASTSACAPDAVATEQQNNKIEASSVADLLKKSKSSLITPSPSIHAFQSDKLDNKVRRTKEKKNSVRETLQENTAPDAGAYRSSYLAASTGPDVRLVKGSNNGMLLEDYVSWDGPDPRLRSGASGLAQGPNRSLLMGRTLAQGPNSALRKGPARGLAQGSLYSQMQTITITESRGK